MCVRIALLCGRQPFLLPQLAAWFRVWLVLCCVPGTAVVCRADLPQNDSERGPAWQRHTVDGSSRGADGVRLADINGDGQPDIVTGWEEGGQIRLAIHPGIGKVRQLWPSVTIGRVKSPEDAVFFDADRDGRLDVVSSCEGGTRSLFVHWSPEDSRQLLNAEAWTTARVPASHGRQRWMYAVPVELDGKPGQELVAAGKGENAEIGWWQLPEKSREVADWKWHPIDTVGWVMSIKPLDVDNDGDTDLLVTDRKGPQRGLWWFENPGAAADNQTAITFRWTRRLIGGREREVMFLTVADLDGDG
ncbi:MAG: VCBS repeat-containing protein, partial [Planctomycetaceae bacterium]|nr:VCBS repeat-containing protein [Planctomycetaceae bacterium]